MEYKACKLYEDWQAWEDKGAFSTEGCIVHNRFTYMVKCSMHVWMLEGSRHNDIQIMQNGVYVGNK
jgi:hypothetical protein